MKAFIFINTEKGLPVSLLDVPDEFTRWEITGQFDLLLLIESNSLEELNDKIDKIRTFPGVKSTLTSLVLKEKKN